MGNTLSAHSTPHLPSLKGKGKGKGKARRQTTEPLAPLPQRTQDLVDRYVRDEQLAARYLAEEKLEGRTPKLVIGDTAASPLWGATGDEEEEELAGLRINVGGPRLEPARRGSSPKDILAARDSEDLRHEAYKMRARAQSASDARAGSSQPLARSRSAATPSSQSLHLSLARRASATSESACLTFRPSSTALSDATGNASPTSHWSESSADGRTPPQTFQSFRTSAAFSLNSKRLSSHSSIQRYSTLFGETSLANDLISPARPLQKAIERGLHGLRTNKENERRRKALKKRGPIVVVGAQRVGSGRYSMMKEAAARSAAARKGSVSSGETGSRRGSKDGGQRRRSSGSEGRRASGSRRGEGAATLGDSVPSPPARHRRTSSAQALMSFIAASPDLTCPDSSTTLFDHHATPRPSISRLPEGHPGNHHSRFRAFNEHVAALPPCPPAPTSSSGPTSLPPRGVLGQRRLSALASSARSSVVSDNMQDGTPIPRRSSSLSAGSSRKLSNFRLSIAEPREEEEQASQSRRNSGASWATTGVSRSRMDSMDYGSSLRTDAGSSSTGLRRRQSSVSLGYALTNQRRASASLVPFVQTAPLLPTTRSASITSRTSFPQSIAYTSGSRDTPPRENRLGSAVSYFSIPPTPMDLPLTPETLPTPLAEPYRVPQISPPGGMSWGSYSLAPAPLPVDSNSRGSIASIASDIAPETVDAFPVPPTTSLLRLHAPAPLVIRKHSPFAYDDPNGVLSDASTPSTCSFESSSASVTSETSSQEESFGSGNGFAHTLEMLSNAVQVSIDEGCKALPSPCLSLGGRSTATFTMDDLLQLGGNSWTSPDAVRTSPLPPSYEYTSVASLPVVSSSPLLPSTPSTPKIQILARRPSEHQLECPSPSLASYAVQPLPTSTKRQPPPIFADFKLRIDSTTPSHLRLPTVVSPMTDPFITGYVQDDDLDSIAPSFVRVVSTTRGTVSKRSFLDCSPTPPHELETEHVAPKEEAHRARQVKVNAEEQVLAVGLGVSSATRPTSTRNPNPDGRRFSFTPRELSMTSPRRDTHPTWTPPSQRKSAGFDLLVEKKTRSASEDNGGVLRLGSVGKRGFSKGEVSDWLARASRETGTVSRKM